MNLIRHILLPVDFSGRCDGAAGFAEEMTRRAGARLTLLHVVEIPVALTTNVEFGAVPMEEFRRAQIASARIRLDGYLAEKLNHLNPRRDVVDGDAGHSIVDYAHGENVSLIMMPTHGLGNFRRYILGSATAKVLHDVKCPVWTGVHMENAPPPEEIHIRRIHCAVDLGPESERIAAWAAALAAEYGAVLTFLHAGPPETRDALASLAQQIAPSANLQVQQGDAAHVLRDFAQRDAADLLVIGRGGAGEEGRLRSRVFGIIRNSPCPVISI